MCYILELANKGIDSINIGNILNHRDVVKNIPHILNVKQLLRYPILIPLHPKNLIISNCFVTSN